MTCFGTSETLEEIKMTKLTFWWFNFALLYSQRCLGLDCCSLPTERNEVTKMGAFKVIIVYG